MGLDPTGTWSGRAEGWTIDNSYLHVGDNYNPTLNPKCSEVPISTSGMYDCNLVGKFVGITRVSSSGSTLGFV